jgi:hypothetical protein
MNRTDLIGVILCIFPAIFLSMATGLGLEHLMPIFLTIASVHVFVIRFAVLKHEMQRTNQEDLALQLMNISTFFTALIIFTPVTVYHLYIGKITPFEVFVVGAGWGFLLTYALILQTFSIVRGIAAPASAIVETCTIWQMSIEAIIYSTFPQIYEILAVLSGLLPAFMIVLGDKIWKPKQNKREPLLNESA